MQYLSPPPPAKACGRGFTLIEISVVLVILALLVGGIVIGQEMIRDSRNRAVVRQINTLETAVFTFREKYQCLPGDCLKASQFNLNGVVNGVTSGNGNGNGRITAFTPTEHSLLDLTCIIQEFCFCRQK